MARLVLEFGQDKEDLLVLLPMKMQKIRNKDVIVSPRPGMELAALSHLWLGFA